MSLFVNLKIFSLLKIKNYSNYQICIKPFLNKIKAFYNIFTKVLYVSMY